MSYKIFLSYAAEELDLAKHVKDGISNAFKGNISIFLASDDILPGDLWKTKTQGVLQEYDCIMTLLTAKYIVRPWAYVEWTAFWINNKKYYTLVTDDVKVDEIFEPMRERQLTELFSEGKVKQLFEALAKDSNTSLIPYDAVASFFTEAKLQYNKIIENRNKQKFGIYKDKLHLLENDDLKREEVLWYFYEQEPDENMVSNIFALIKDNTIKMRILLKLLDKGDLPTVRRLYDKVEVKANLLPVFSRVVEIDKDSELIDELIESVSDSQEVLRNMGQFVIKNGMTSSPMLLNIVDRFANMAELKKIGSTLMENGYSGTSIFDSVMDKLYERNRAEARNLLINAILNIERFTPKEMLEHITKLAALNKTEAVKVPERFPVNDTFKPIVVELLARKIFTEEQEGRLRAQFGL